ncbi:MAG: hypothetical protein PHH77_06405 [Victivallaceae bacterium]|nr:hypothetical protein [Victivallaceae bacterium]
MTRTQRLEYVKCSEWLRRFTGRKMAHRYCRWFGVKPAEALEDLRTLGVEITPEYEKQVLSRVALPAKPCRKKKTHKTEDEFIADSDDNFAYIAGYTSMGFPYGITWEEMKIIDRKDLLDDKIL